MRNPTVLRDGEMTRTNEHGGLISFLIVKPS